MPEPALHRRIRRAADKAGVGAARFTDPLGSGKWAFRLGDACWRVIDESEAEDFLAGVIEGGANVDRH